MRTVVCLSAFLAITATAVPATAQVALPLDNPAYVRSPGQEALIEAAQGAKAPVAAQCAAGARAGSQTAAADETPAGGQPGKRRDCQAATGRPASTPLPSGQKDSPETSTQRKRD